MLHGTPSLGQSCRQPFRSCYALGMVLHPLRDPSTPRLLVADSFRVRRVGSGTEVRGMQHHLARFCRTAWVASDHSLPGLGNFLDAAGRAIIEFGEGFPRLELWGDDAGSHELRVSLRPLPELRDEIDLVTVGALDLRHPERKGPNLDVLTKLSRDLGAEALLTSPAGTVREGGSTALVWWEGDYPHVSASPRRVPSVAERLVREASAQYGRAMTPARITPSELAGFEVWAVNALHGIRSVSRIDGRSQPPPDSERLKRYREALEQTWRPVDLLLSQP